MKRCSSDLISVSPSFIFDEKDSIDQILPTEVIQRALSNLAPSDMQSTVLVSRGWKKVTVDLNKQIFLEIRNYAIFLGDNLQNSYERKELILSYLKKHPFQLESLPEIESSAFSLKEELLAGLDQLNLPDLQNLKNLADSQPQPLYFENFFEIVKLFIGLNDPPKNLENIFFSLIQHGYLAKVKNYIETTVPSLRKGGALHSLVCELLIHNDFEKALEIAGLIKHDIPRSMALEHICRDLNEKKHFGWAVQIFTQMPSNYYKKTTGKHLRFSLKQAGELELKETVKSTLAKMQEKPPVIVRFG